MANRHKSKQDMNGLQDETVCCPLGETARNIANTFQNMVMQRGFNAVSYGDLAKELGIRTASIHYHFPTKAELGATVLTRYRDNIINAWEEVKLDDPQSYVRAYNSFIAPIRSVRDLEGVSCLYGVLGATQKTLCPNIQEILAGFFIEQEVWLAKVFAGGRDVGVFHFNGEAQSFTKLYISALQGAMLIKKSTNNPAHFDDVIEQLETMLFAKA